MATGTVQFQSTTLATPLAGLSVMADAVNDTDHGAGTAQYVKVMDGRTAGTIKAAVTSSGLEVDVTRVQGTVQALGSIQGVGTFQVLGTVQTHGTSQVLGSVQGVGTFQALGTFQPLAGSVHLAAGSVNAQGVIAHGAAIAGNPLLFGGFGSSGTQAAVDDGDIARVALDLNGRVWTNVQTFAGTIAGGTFQPHGTVQVLGTVQPHGTTQVLGSVQGVGTFQVLGTVQTHGTSQALGSVQAVGTTQTKEVRSGANFGTRIAGTIGNLIILAANANRLGAMFYLESGSALFLKLGSSAGTFDYTLQLGTSGYYEVPYNYTGTISGIWQFANGTVQITEVS